MTDYATMRTRIADELNRTDAGAWINREINDAIAHYESTRTKFNEVRDWVVATTVAGTRYYSVTSNFIKMDTLKIVYNGSLVTLKKRTWAEIDAKDTQSTPTQGLPAEYAVYGTEVRPFPVANGAYSLVGSYIRSFPAASLTGSATSTASDARGIGPNPANGWFTDGEALIRARAKAGVEIRYLRKSDAIAEMRQLALQGLNFLSVEEKIAHSAFKDEIAESVSTGKIRPYNI